jgi:hypothetical protein
MMIFVTEEICPELAADTRNEWWQIGEGYFTTDTAKTVCIEIFRKGPGKFKWSLYDANSPDPELAVTQSDDDSDTLAKCLADAYDYLNGYEPYPAKK